MLLPSKIDQWYAEAVTRVYAPWLTSSCAGISERQRRDVSELIRRARRTACLPPLGAHPVRDVLDAPATPAARGAPGARRSARQEPGRRPMTARAASGRWTASAA